MARNEQSQIVTRKVKIKLSESELLERGESMSQAELRIEDLKLQRNGLNSRIKEQVSARNALAHVIESELEERETDCKWEADLRSNQWKLNRVDTGECIETRTMTAEDRQGELQFPSSDVDDEGGELSKIAEVEAGDDDGEFDDEHDTEAAARVAGVFMNHEANHEQQHKRESKRVPRSSAKKPPKAKVTKGKGKASKKKSTRRAA